MSKTIPIALASDYAQPTTTLACCLKVERKDGGTVALTSLDVPCEVDDVIYLPGFDISSLVSTSDLAVDNLELSVLENVNVLTREDLQAGLWDYALFTIFEVNYVTPANGINVLKKGTTGESQLKQGAWTIELRSRKQALQQSLVQYTSKTCRYRLGSTALPGGLCMVDLTPFTFNGTVTTGGSDQVFTDTSQVQADEYFVEGPVKFTSGDNAGFERKCKIFAAGVFTMATAFPYAIGAGDEFTAVAGCQKRHERTSDNPSGVSDCLDKFDNVLNFGGEPHIVGTDSLTADPQATGS